MPRTIELLLLENVESLGIVGDIKKVKPGYARNYLFPMGLAEKPTPEKIESLKEARAAAQAEVEALRSARERLIERMEELEVKIVRAANDLGALYGSVTQRDIADALERDGYEVEPRAIRLKASIRRTGEYHVPVQFEKDLKTEITVLVESDRKLEELDELAEEEEAERERSEAGMSDDAENKGESPATEEATA